MKKVVMLLVAALAIGLAQAAQVKWNTGAASAGFTDENGAAFSAATTGYTLTVYLWDSTGANLLDQQSTSTFTALGTASGTMSYAASASTSYMLSAVLEKDDGTASLTMDKAAFTTPGSGAKTLTIATGANFATTGSKWASGGWETSGTPEPTSGMLLLLGGAMLALRRKQKK